MRIEIENVQSIEKLVIDGGPLVMMMGPSNSGKTTVHRAMRFLLEGGRVNFDRLLKHGKDRMSVLLARDGHSVMLKRSKDGENTMVIDGKIHTKISTERPPELGTIGYRGIEANKMFLMPQLASQHSKYFLVGEDADAVARAEALASTASKHLKGVISASRAAAAGEKQARQQARFYEEEASKVRTRLKGYEEAKSIEERVAKLEKENAEVAKLQKRLTQLKQLTGKRKRCTAVLEASKQLELIELPVLPVQDTTKLKLLATIQTRRKKLTTQKAAYERMVEISETTAPSGRKLGELLLLRKRAKQKLIVVGLFEKVGEVPVTPEQTRGKLLRELKRKRGAAIDTRDQSEREEVENERELQGTKEEEQRLRVENPSCPVCGKEW